MSNPSPKTKHLEDTRWQPGQSGNPAGKPKGTRHISTYIREMMEDDSFMQKLPNGRNLHGAPAKAIVKTIIAKAANGDLRAFDLLCKYGYGAKIEVEPDQLPIPLLSRDQLKGLLEARARAEE